MISLTELTEAQLDTLITTRDVYDSGCCVSGIRSMYTAEVAKITGKSYREFTLQGVPVREFLKLNNSTVNSVIMAVLANAKEQANGE